MAEPDRRWQPEPRGTRSQIIRYLDEDGQIVVEVSRYLRPDGSLGASGKPDPKRLRCGNTMYVAESGTPGPQMRGGDFQEQ